VPYRLVSSVNLKVKIGTGTVAVTDRHYLGAGGEAAIYKNGNEVLKLYHDASKMIPVGKIKELASIKAHNVIKPLEVVYDAANGTPLGYSMKFLKDTEPLCKLFTKTFKVANNIGIDMIVDLVKAMQLTVAEVHRDKCLIVDFNELNVLVDDTFDCPFFIDTDSYQTPNYRATAIMDSIRDRLAKPGHFSDLTDWFSWGILAVQLYLNIHPYKGSHPSYRPAEWNKRMDDGVSIFDKKVKLPPVCNPFAIIPKRHLEWFKAVFQKGERSVPPLPDASAPLPVPKAINIIKGNESFEVEEKFSVSGAILSLMHHNGILYTLTKDTVYVNDKESGINVSKSKRAFMLTANDGTLIVALHTAGYHYSFIQPDGKQVGTAQGTGCFVRNQCAYTTVNGKLYQHRMMRLGQEIVQRTNSVENVTALSAQVYDGMVIQDLLGRKYITIPYAEGRCLNRPAHDLDGFRVVDARGERNVCIVLAEQKGVYHKFVYTFDQHFSSYAVRHVPGVAYDAINFTVLETGPCVHLSAPDEVEVFNAGSIRVLNNPPFDSTMRLFSAERSVYFVNNDTVFKVRLK
jgi:hypothetical protein